MHPLIHAGTTRSHGPRGWAASGGGGREAWGCHDGLLSEENAGDSLFWVGKSGVGRGCGGPHRIGVRGMNAVGDRGSVGSACSALRLAPPVLCADRDDDDPISKMKNLKGPGEGYSVGNFCMDGPPEFVFYIVFYIVFRTYPGRSLRAATRCPTTCATLKRVFGRLGGTQRCT